MGFNVTYMDLSESNTQYDDIEFKMGELVDARYIKPVLDIDKGNIFIEALPPVRNEQEIEIAYSNDIPSYSFEKTKEMTKIEKMLAVGQIRILRFQLPFHERLEFEFYDVLLQSYREKKLLFSNNGSVGLCVGNAKKENTAILVGDSAKATNAGLSLIGFSGCGKSSAVDILVSRYPQVIIHRVGEIAYFPQIVYLVVNCVANSNFAALYESMGDAIDKALGNIEPVYAKEIKKCRSLGSKAEKVKELIEKFAVGAIILDEIQLIDFEHTKENTFDSLLTLANKTKTAIMVVGTEDAKDKMFMELRTTRRLGVLVNGNGYCSIKGFFDLLVENLFDYQWFDEFIECTQEIKDTLYDLTKGIIDQLISIYRAVHIEYLNSNKKPVINGEYFRKVARKYYPGIQNVLADLEKVENVQKLNKIRSDAEKLLAQTIDEAKQTAKSEKIIQNAGNTADRTMLLKNITTTIHNLYDYSDDQIQTAFKKVMSRKASEDKDEKEIGRLVMEQLEKLRSKPRVTGRINKSIDAEHMKSFLNMEED